MSICLVLAGVASVILLQAQNSGQSSMPRSLTDADQLEAQVETNPTDLNARLMLLRYYWSAPNVPADRVKTALRKHAVWVIEQHPDHLSLNENWASLTGDSEATDAAGRVWRKHLAAPSPTAPVYSHALRFFRLASSHDAQAVW